MIKLITTNSFNDESRYDIAMLQALNVKDSIVYVIVPEQYTLQAEKDLLELLGSTGLFNVEVLSFKRIIFRISELMGRADIKPLTDLGKKMLLAEVLEQLSDQLTLYKNSRHIRGFLDELADTIADFRHQSATAEQLNLLSEMGNQSLFKIKLIEMSLIYSCYIARFDEITFDSDALIDSAIDFLSDHQPFKRTHFIVEGFSSMTQNEQRLLVALASQCQNLTLRILDDGTTHLVNRYVSKLTANFSALCKEAGLPLKRNVYTKALSPMARGFRGVFSAKPIKHQIALVRATNREQALMSIYLEMVKHYKQGDKWQDMAILSNDLATDFVMAQRLANNCQIPLFIDARRPAISHYIVDFILSSTRTVMSAFAGREVIKVLKTGFFKIDYDVLCDVENYVLSHDVKGGKWQNEWADDEASLFLYHAVQEALAHMLSLKEKFKQSDNAKHMTEALKDYLDQCEVFAFIKADIAEKYDGGDYDAAELMAQIHNIIDDVLHQIYTLGETRKMSIKQFYDLLKLAFESYEIGIIPQEQDYVTLGNIRRSRLAEVKHLYLLAFNDGVIPSKDSTSQLFNDDEMVWLERHGIKKVRRSEERYNEEVFKTYENILKTVGKVTCYYTAYATDGTPNKPSLWFEQLAIGKKVDAVNYTLDDLLKNGLVKPFIDCALTDLKEGKTLSADSYSGLCTLLNHPAYGKLIKAYFEGATYDNQPSPLSNVLSSALYGEHLTTSITRLESFARCPYQHFISYGVKPEIRQEKTINGFDMGNLYHDVIEKVMNYLADRDINLIEQMHWQFYFDMVYEQALKQSYRFTLNPKNQYFARRLKTVLETSIDNAIRQIKCGQFKNMANEIGFGDNQYAKMPALSLTDTAQNSVSLVGKIDRIDILDQTDSHYLRIIDYKSSNKQLDVNEVLYGLNLQLMIYLDVATHYAAKWYGSQARSFGAFYFCVNENTLESSEMTDENIALERFESYKMAGVFIDNTVLAEASDQHLLENDKAVVISAVKKKDGTLRSANHILTAEELAVLQSYAVKKAALSARQIYAGDIAIAPVMTAGFTACQYCQYRDICKFDQNKTPENYRYLAKQNKQVIIKKMQEVIAHEID